MAKDEEQEAPKVEVRPTPTGTKTLSLDQEGSFHFYQEEAKMPKAYGGS